MFTPMRIDARSAGVRGAMLMLVFMQVQWKRGWELIALLACISAAGGCSTLNKSECLAADWQSIGYEDGVAGHTDDRLAQHRKACAKHGVAPDLELYRAGREQGLREFCQPPNGFRAGAAGYHYSGVCTRDLEPAFLAAYESGHRLYVLQSRVSDATSRLEARRAELQRIEGTVARKSVLIVSDESTEDERAQALVETKELAERAGKLESEIRQLERDRVNYQRDLDEYRATLAVGG
jgi:Protein of unknown function (DUF2799)